MKKERNFTQLRNQIDRIEANHHSGSSVSNASKALVEAIKEFKENGGSNSPVDRESNSLNNMSRSRS